MWRQNELLESDKIKPRRNYAALAGAIAASVLSGLSCGTFLFVLIGDIVPGAFWIAPMVMYVAFILAAAGLFLVYSASVEKVKKWEAGHQKPQNLGYARKMSYDRERSFTQEEMITDENKENMTAYGQNDLKSQEMAHLDKL
jgi:hypothetical protein